MPFILKHELRFLPLDGLYVLKLFGNKIFNLFLIGFNTKSTFCSWQGSNSKWIFSSFVVEACSTSIARLLMRVIVQCFAWISSTTQLIAHFR